MSSKLMGIEVRGKRKRWMFHFYADPAYIADWQADGLDVHVIENSIPADLPVVVPVRVWVFLQDLFNFKNPFRK